MSTAASHPDGTVLQQSPQYSYDDDTILTFAVGTKTYKVSASHFSGN